LARFLNKIGKANIAAMDNFLDIILSGPIGEFFKSRAVAVGIGDDSNKHTG
jgi:hypothetical protein